MSEILFIPIKEIERQVVYRFTNNLFGSDNVTLEELKFEVLTIALISAIVRRKWEQGAVKKKNHISIATIFKVAELGLLFSGNIENQTIIKISNYYFENLFFIKTPHHTSESSSRLIEKIEKGFDGVKISTVNTTYFSSDRFF
ncbi:hypothetical protein [Plebeiibacterium sediminum]|uniref:Uncharacterized protein n=1 Tax=Plebeiibacterium sediminum TaxID=2992112 RepID=A0AAE3SG59_9BACT|nr:hypothetical protein [Plebeiobacterium sediminum]MCW3788160.1 hypothetical protein [Plebeiobacterium sediminum]